MKIFIKLTITFLCVSSIFAQVLSYEQLLKNWREKVDGSLYDWRLYLNADGVLVRDGFAVHSVKDYNLPDLSFYKDSNLKGEVFAEIDKNGIYIQNELVCKRKKHEESVEVNYGVYEKYVYDRFYSLVKQDMREVLCKDLPFYEDGGKEEPIRFILNLLDLKGKIGKLHMKGHTLYVDASPFLKQPIKKPVKVMLIEKYGIDEFNKIESLFKIVRVAYQKKDLKTLNDLFYNQCLEILSNWSEKKRTRECENKILKRDFDFYKKRRIIDATIYELYRGTDRRFKKDSFHLDSNLDRGSVYIFRYNDNWIIHNIVEGT